MSIGEQLSALRDRSGLTLHQIASKADYSGRSSVQKFFTPEYDPQVLDRHVATRLARALVGRGNPPITDEEIFALTGATDTERPRYNYLEIAGLKRDVPVNIAEIAPPHMLPDRPDGLDLYRLEMDTPIGFAWHPPAIPANRKITAIQIAGRSPLPRYRPGELLFVDGLRPARFGDDVCVFLSREDGIDAGFGGGILSTVGLVFFGTYERQAKGTIYVRTFDGEGLIELPEVAIVQIVPLLNLTEALYVEEHTMS